MPDIIFHNLAQSTQLLGVCALRQVQSEDGVVFLPSMYNALQDEPRWDTKEGSIQARRHPSIVLFLWCELDLPKLTAYWSFIYSSSRESSHHLEFTAAHFKPDLFYTLTINIKPAFTPSRVFSRCRYTEICLLIKLAPSYPDFRTPANIYAIEIQQKALIPWAYLCAINLEFNGLGALCENYRGSKSLSNQ